MSRPTTLHIGGTVYWVMRLYDPTDGITLIDADSTPTVAVRKNGSAVGDSVTVTKRSATTGIYDCSYNPSGEAEGDKFTLEESAVISSDTYTQNWELVVVAVERGTDSAYTGTPPTAVAIRDEILNRVLAGNHELAGTLGKLMQSITETRLAELDPANLPANLDSLLALAADIYTDTGNILADTAIVLARLTASRAGYLDNLNVGGAVASQADILAINQSASRRIILSTVGQYERPESGSTTFWIEARTYDGDGAATNADSSPTLTGTGVTTGSLAANIGTISNPATGVYRWDYTVGTAHNLEQIRFDISATIGGTAFPLAVFSQVVDFVAVEFTSTDQANLTAIFNKLPSRNYLAGSTAASGAFATSDIGLASANLDTQLSGIVTDISNSTDTLSILITANGTAIADIPTNAEMANVFTLATRYLTMIQVSGANWQYTNDAVENAPSGGGGGGGGGDPIVVLVPGIAQVPERARGRLIELYVQEAITIAVPVLDANGDPMDLSAVDLWFGATDRRGTLQINTASSGSVTGTETGFSLTVPKQTSPADDWKWALRYDDADGVNIVDGPLTIKFSPSKP